MFRTPIANFLSGDYLTVLYAPNNPNVIKIISVAESLKRQLDNGDISAYETLQLIGYNAPTATIKASSLEQAKELFDAELNNVLSWSIFAYCTRITDGDGIELTDKSREIYDTLDISFLSKLAEYMAPHTQQFAAEIEAQNVAPSK